MTWIGVGADPWAGCREPNSMQDSYSTFLNQNDMFPRNTSKIVIHFPSSRAPQRPSPHQKPSLARGQSRQACMHTFTITHRNPYMVRDRHRRAFCHASARPPTCRTSATSSSPRALEQGHATARGRPLGNHGGRRSQALAGGEGPVAHATTLVACTAELNQLWSRNTSRSTSSGRGQKAEESHLTVAWQAPPPALCLPLPTAYNTLNLSVTLTSAWRRRPSPHSRSPQAALQYSHPRPASAHITTGGILAAVASDYH